MDEKSDKPVEQTAKVTRMPEKKAKAPAAPAPPAPKERTMELPDDLAQKLRVPAVVTLVRLRKAMNRVLNTDTETYLRAKAEMMAQDVQFTLGEIQAAEK